MRDRGSRIAFLLTGVLFFVAVLAIFIDDTTPEWRRYQLDYRARLVARAQDPQERASAENLPLEVRQIVVPDTGAVDRCETCHIAVEDPSFAEAKQPLRYHPNHAQHPFAKFGCTVCHGGQGRAVHKDAAHGHVPHWDRPLLPMEFIQAACGKCHYARGLTAAPILMRGRGLFETKGCRGCHKMNGVGGVIGPDLTTVARAGGRPPQWLMQHFRDPQAVVPGSAMPRYDLSENEIKALTMYMLSRTDQRLGPYFLSQRFIPSPEVGRELFEEKGCIGCHSVKGIGGTVGPALDNVGQRHDSDWLYRHFKNPRALTPNTVMPTFGFTDAEAKALTLFVVSLTDDSAYTPKEIGAFQTPEERGRALFVRFGCIGCHGPDGKGGVPNPNAATAQQVPGLQYVAQGYTAAELSQKILTGQQDIPREDPNGPRPPLYMPAWKGVLTPAQVDDLTVYLFSLLPAEAADEDW